MNEGEIERYFLKHATIGGPDSGHFAMAYAILQLSGHTKFVSEEIMNLWKAIDTMPGAVHEGLTTVAEAIINRD